MKRVFLPGDRWIYYKIYCGAYTSQSILIDNLVPIIKTYEDENAIVKWFFVRYSDPEFHLRVRIELSNQKYLSLIIQDLSESLEGLTTNNIIWNVELSTYKREIERYGEGNIALTESLFFISSVRVCNLLALNDNSDNYSLHVLRSVNEILTMFGLSDDDKLAFAKANRDYFKTEFKTKKSLNARINVESIRIRTLISNSFPDKDVIYAYSSEELLNIIDDIKNNLMSSNKSLVEYLSSIVHMHLNRAFMDDIRYYEFILHSLLFKHYAFIKATEK